MHGDIDNTDQRNESGCPIKGGAVADAGGFSGYHHFMGIKPKTGSRLGMTIDSQDQNSLQYLLSFLAKLIGGNMLHDGDSETWRNERVTDEHGQVTYPGFPSGYTYLLQLATHDIVHTSVSITPVAGVGRTVRNRRQCALDGDTLFGGGPSVCPFPYAATKAENEFRTKLKLAPTAGRHPSPDFDRPPMRDIRRVQTPDEVQDVMIADPRNEDTAILGQLTALFHAFHNGVVDRMRSAYNDGNVSYQHGESISDIGICARAVTALIFRDIIRHDLLVRLLDPRVYDAYATNPEFFDKPPIPGSIPLEFAHSVSRIGHQLVRPTYLFNGRTDSVRSLEELFHAKTNTRRRSRRNEFPLRPSWVIDWAFFFDVEIPKAYADCTPSPALFPTEARTVNWAPKIRAHLVNFLNRSNEFTPPYIGSEYAFAGGLQFRDFIRGAASNVCSVSEIVASLKDVLEKRKTTKRLVLQDLFDETQRQTLIDRGLQTLSSESDLTATGIPDEWKEGMERIRKDPPLLLYALMEAQEGPSEGRYLGPLTSILFAEVFFRALHRERGYVDDHTAQWEQMSRRWAEKAFESEGGPPQTMTALINAVHRNNPEALVIPCNVY